MAAHEDYYADDSRHPFMHSLPGSSDADESGISEIRREGDERELIYDNVLADLINQIDANVKLEPDVEKHVRSAVYDFIVDAFEQAIRAAQARQSASTKNGEDSTGSLKSVNVSLDDMQFVLRRYFGTFVPGFGHSAPTALAPNGRTERSVNENGENEAAPPGGAKDQYGQMYEAHKNRLALIKKTLKKF